jgi:hypothetical protein
VRLPEAAVQALEEHLARQIEQMERSVTSTKISVLVLIYKHSPHPSWCFEPCSQRAAPSV